MRMKAAKARIFESCLERGEHLLGCQSRDIIQKTFELMIGTGREEKNVNCLQRKGYRDRGG